MRDARQLKDFLTSVAGREAGQLSDKESALLRLLSIQWTGFDPKHCPKCYRKSLGMLREIEVDDDDPVGDVQPIERILSYKGRVATDNEIIQAMKDDPELASAVKSIGKNVLGLNMGTCRNCLVDAFVSICGLKMDTLLSGWRVADGKVLRYAGGYVTCWNITDELAAKVIDFDATQRRFLFEATPLLVIPEEIETTTAETAEQGGETDVILKEKTTAVRKAATKKKRKK